MRNPRFVKYKFKNGKVAKNRVVVPPMASQTADALGFATDATIQHYARLSESGAGIIFVEYSFVHSTGKGEANQLGADKEENVPGLSRIAQVIHDAGSLAGLQLVHVGGKTTSGLTGVPLMGPSAIPVPVKGWESETPLPMSEGDIQIWTSWFVAGAKRVEAAGFDIVELHAAHGYGLNQWLSPLTNQRTDGFGGTIKNRSRLLLDIAKRIKAEVPNLLLAVRLPAQDHAPGGLSTHEMAWVVQQLEAVGVDLIDVSSGIGGWRRLDSGTEQGYLVQDAALLKSHVSVPIIGVGGIETGDFIDAVLQAENVDFTAVGRAILKDPLVWGQKHLGLSCHEMERVFSQA